jgi:hypothetical protein
LWTGFWWGSLREGDRWGDPDVDGEIILRGIFRKWEGFTQYCGGGKIEKNEMGWAFSAYVEERVVHRVLVGKLEGRRPLGRPRRRWEDNINPLASKFFQILLHSVFKM